MGSLVDLTTRWSWSLPRVLQPDPLPGLDLPLPLRCLLLRRGIATTEAALTLLKPDDLPEPRTQFPDLTTAVNRVCQACLERESVAICGDYDADGMTSTALLLRALTPLGANPIAAIPSRMEDGYGLNPGMVQDLFDQGIRLLITVDNGVAAWDALELAKQLGLEVIVTDHHSIPDPRPPMTALLHPAETPVESPFRGLAGVGLAYVLARAVAEQLEQPDAIAAARDLFCIGTVADMAPLSGANRLWLLEGLQQLHRSECEGLRALQRLSGLGQHPLRAEDIGFQLAPRINAVGRLGKPQLIVDLLTVQDSEEAMLLARRCDDFNRQRRDLCDAIEAEAIALVEADEQALPPFLLLAQGHWHHGVIGIVAARLVEKYHRPTALLAGEGNGRMRASVRAPNGFAVDTALKQCGDLLDRYGGHPAAGGFTVDAAQVHRLHERLNKLALSWLSQQGDGIPVQPEVLIRLSDINWDFWHDLVRLEPFGAGHAQPLFWCRDCQIVESRLLKGRHLSITLLQDAEQRRAIAWRWPMHQPVPERCDVAFQIGMNRWQGEDRLQLDVKALRQHSSSVALQRGQQTYLAQRLGPSGLKLRNGEGDELEAQLINNGQLVCSDRRANHPQVRQLLEEACLGLGLRP